MRESWPDFTVRRYMGTPHAITSTRDERNELLEQAEVIYGGFPFPLDCVRAHQSLGGFTNDRRARVIYVEVICGILTLL